MKARNLLEEANIKREKGEFLESLKLLEEALTTFQQENDLLGMAETQSSKFLTYKLLYQKTKGEVYLTLAKYAALCGVKIAKQSENLNALCIPYMNLGEAFALIQKWEKAVRAYKKAVDWFEKAPPPFDNRPAVLLNIKDHLYTAEYKTGDKSALERAEKLIPELEKDPEEDSYNKNVWLSGAHGRIAEMIYKEDRQKALEHLQKAREIIDSDERLVLRKMQWEKLNEVIASDPKSAQKQSN